MRRISGILLLSTLLLPLVGMYGFIQYKKMVVRSEVKHRLMEELDESELVTLTFTTKEAANLEWEHAREFEYRGRMYDVVHQRQLGDLITYVCWPDDDESLLNKQLDRLAAAASQKKSDQDQSNQLILRLLKGLFYFENSDTQAFRHEQKLMVKAHQFNLQASPYLGIDSPPPRLS